MRSAADHIAPLADQAPHRGMRELHSQTFAYLRAYTDSLATYTPADDHLALVTPSPTPISIHLAQNRIFRRAS